jgi:Peptidase inhibitor I78 family
VGKSRSKAVGAKALRLSGASTLRWVPKDGMVTMDYREDRLNLHLDSKNRIVRVACG